MPSARGRRACVRVQARDPVIYFDGDGSYLGAGEDLGPIGPLSQVLEHF